MNNIQKNFKAKSKLRGLADGGQPNPRMLGTGMAQRAGSAIQSRRAQLEDSWDESQGGAPAQPATPAQTPAKKKGGSALRSFFGLADGGTADVSRILHSRDTSIFTPQEMQRFNAMGQSAMAEASQMQDVGVQAGQNAMASVRPAELPTSQQPTAELSELEPPEENLADGGEVKGKGGPTEDKVGPVALSDKEYVLPADTVEIVGRENLDALRLATHNFVDEDNKPKVSGLRKMANGGTLYVDPEGVANKNLPQSRAMVPYTPPSQASSLRSAVSSGGGRVGNFLRGGLPIAGVAGAANSVADVGSGYADKFYNDMGAKSTAGTVAADTARVLGNVGDAVTFGAAGRVGRGLANIGSEGGFAKGFMSQSDRDAYNQQQTQRVMGQPSQPHPLDQGVSTPQTTGSPTVNPIQQGSYQSNRLAEMGVPVDQQNASPITAAERNRLREGGGTPGQYVNMGSFGGDSNIYGTASKPGGRIDTYVGVGTNARGGQPAGNPVMDELRSALRDMSGGGGRNGANMFGMGGGSGGSNASAINARYDKLDRELSRMYGAKGQGNLARRKLELEQARSGALDADARNLSALRGQDMQASASARQSDMQARLQAIQTLGGLANQQNQQAAQAQNAQLKALQNAQKMGMEREEKGFERYNSAISNMFVGPDGKPDAAEQEKFTSFLQASDPQAREKFSAMAPQDQMVLLQNFKTMYDMNKARNNTATKGLLNSGAVTNKADMPVDVREATFNDVWKNHRPVTDYIKSNLPFTNPNVVVTESGQPVPLSDYATTNGQLDADKLELIRQRTGKDESGKKSALRR